MPCTLAIKIAATKARERATGRDRKLSRIVGNIGAHTSGLSIFQFG
eukprot:CAMPEP_0119429394 /NCGR_PEP_ID=MMETSP1335-20130426/42135_1 /TAXON_ID=259385 /ORGANISM="Chrysoculter rhomboideus, Strain RCC1486" /LENGTH=45 /DNA_ID= /DNA_START= /DNA_END= /DNA_ORIENTATION=